MNFFDYFPALNIFILPILGYLIRLENRVTKMEILLKAHCNGTKDEK